MSDETLWACLFLWGVVAFFAFMARLNDTDEAGDSVAAGILWPIYLPYRLALIMWSRKP